MSTTRRSRTETTAPQVETPPVPQTKAQQTEACLDFVRKLSQSAERDRGKVTEATVRLGRRLARMLREYDAFGVRMQRFMRANETVSKFQFVNQPVIDNISIRENRKLVCVTKTIKLEVPVPATGRNAIVPIGVFEISVEPHSDVGDPICERLAVVVRNTTAPAGTDRAYDHPHVRNGRVCWGDLQNAVVMYEREFRFLELIDMALAILTSYNPNSAYMQVLTGWGKYMEPNDRICDQCLLPLTEAIVNGRRLKCACSRCNTCREVMCICARVETPPVPNTPQERRFIEPLSALDTERADDTLGDTGEAIEAEPPMQTIQVDTGTQLGTQFRQAMQDHVERVTDELVQMRVITPTGGGQG